MKKKPENIFILFALIFGLVLVSYTPPFQVPDEANHFFRAYGLSEGNIIADIQEQQAGSMLPTSLSNVADRIGYPLHFRLDRKVNHSLTEEFLRQPLEPNIVRFTEYSNTALYSPVAYLPQIIGIFIGKSFGLSPLWLLYLGRILNLFFWITLVYVSIRLTPILKWGFLSVALMPMSLSLASSLSADAMTNGLSFLFLSFVLNMIVAKQSYPVSDKSLLALFLTSICLILTKISYGLFLCWVFLIPPSKFRHDKTATIVVLFSLAALAAAVWNNMAKGSYMPVKSWVNLDQQFNFILHNPLKYLEILTNTYTAYLHKIPGEIVGLLGHGDTPLPGIFIYFYLIGLLLLVLSEKSGDYILEKSTKIWIMIMLIATVIIISTFVYLSFNPVAYPLITSIQGRYFIPLLIPSLLLLYKTRIPFLQQVNITENKLPILACSLAVIGFLTTFMTLYYRFYAG